ncbi:hypothetical protein [Mycolicibacterium houstonense]|uniref:hypothetical protein n=1 Tax=Mycolicibacterium houstonense TaxID=146021 RepID=UPI003F95DC8C
MPPTRFSSSRKLTTGSNASLFTYNDAGDLVIAGPPVFTSIQVDSATLFLGSKVRNVLVTRTGTTVERSTVSACLSYAMDIMANYRYGIGFLHEVANVRGYHAS